MNKLKFDWEIQLRTWILGVAAAYIAKVPDPYAVPAGVAAGAAVDALIFWIKGRLKK